MSALLELDTLDDRREIWHLLHRLPPADRVRFLRYACASCVPNRKGHLPAPCVRLMRTTVADARRCDDGDRRFTNEVYADLIQVVSGWALDPVAVANRLVEWVRRPAARRVPAAPSSASSGSTSAAPARTPCSAGSARPAGPRTPRTRPPS